jgi:Arc/MetJ-type ribon-helix-helix transcriptional regulator
MGAHHTSDVRLTIGVVQTFGGELVKDDMEKVTIRLPKQYLRRLDFLVRVDDFPSRSEAIRTAVRDLLYARVDLVLEKQKRLLELDLKEAELEEVEKQYLKP